MSARFRDQWAAFSRSRSQAPASSGPAESRLTMTVRGRWTSRGIPARLGLVWLGVGIFVLFKQGSQSPFVLHFAAVCLAAFTFHVYRAIGTGQDFDRDAANQSLKSSEIQIVLDLNMGDESATVWTCEYSYDYIKINAEYHT